MSDSEIHVKNQTERVLRVRVDCSRNLLTNNGDVTFKASYTGVGLGFSTSQNVEYNVYHNVNTADSFTTIHINGTSTFRLQNNGEYHAYMTVLSKNDDGSWYTVTENHPITKRCHVVIDHNIYVHQHYRNYIQAHKVIMLKEALQISLLNPLNLMRAFMFNPLIFPGLVVFDCAKTIISKDCIFSTGDYRFGKIVVFNKSSKNIWVKVEADVFDVRRETTRNSANVNVTQPIQPLNITPGSVEISSNGTLDRNIYYRANQGTGFILLRNRGDNELRPTVFYLKSPDNQYYLSINYEKDDGTIEHYYYKHPDQLLDASVFDGAFCIPFITISDDGNEIKVETEKRDVTFHPLEILRDVIRNSNSQSSTSSPSPASEQLP